VNTARPDSVRTNRWRIAVLVVLVLAAAGVGATLSQNGSDTPASRPNPRIKMSATRVPTSVARSTVTAAAMSSRGDVALGTKNGRVRVFPPGATRFGGGIELFGDSSSVELLAFSADGSSVAASTDGGSVRVWRVKSREAVALRMPGGAFLSSLALSSDAHLLAAADFNISVYDLRRERRIATFEQPVSDGGASPYAELRFDTSASDVLASADGLDKWNLATGRGTHCPCGSGAISHNARYHSSGTAGGHVVVTDTRSRRQLADITADISGRAGPAQISDDGQRLVAGISDGVVAVWRSPRQITPPTRKRFAREPIVGLQLTAAGDRMLVETQLPDEAFDKNPPGARNRWLVSLK